MSYKSFSHSGTVLHSFGVTVRCHIQSGDSRKSGGYFISIAMLMPWFTPAQVLTVVRAKEEAEGSEGEPELYALDGDLPQHRTIRRPVATSTAGRTKDTFGGGGKYLQ